MKSNNNAVPAVCLSHIGKRRTHEDNFVFNGKYLPEAIQKAMVDQRTLCLSSCNTDRVIYYAVCDGMGGHNAGEVASRICAEKLASLRQRLQDCVTIQEAVAVLQKAIEKINEITYRVSVEQSDLSGMGTTLTLFVMLGSQYAVLNIGDSRAYFYDASPNGGSLVQLTKDHTEGQRALDMKLLTKEEVKQFPSRKRLTRYIGYKPDGFIVKADEYISQLRYGIILLCSDGVSNALSNEQIESMLNSELNSEKNSNKPEDR